KKPLQSNGLVYIYLKYGGGRGIRTPAGFDTPFGFQDRPLQPDLGIPPYTQELIYHGCLLLSIFTVESVKFLRELFSPSNFLLKTFPNQMISQSNGFHFGLGLYMYVRRFDTEPLRA